MGLRGGDVVAGRFEIERPARAPEGSVHRALDRSTGLPVAIRLTPVAPAERDAEIARATALGELAHSAIPRQIAAGAHGDTVFVAAEWIDGEDLATRLARGPLDVAGALLLARRVAAALSLAHARGVIHGGVGPRRILLAGGSPQRAALTGFGAARAMAASPYLAPEQATLGSAIDTRADVHALGAVLFECLSGRPLFAAAHPIALLTRIALEEALRISTLRNDVPEGLDALLSRMLSKSPLDRPRDAASLAFELAAIDPSLERWSTSEATAPDDVSERDRRRLYLVVAGPADPAAPGAIEDAVEPYGARVDRLVGGAVLASIAGRGNATDQAAQAAFSALVVRRAIPGAPVVAATSAGTLAGDLPVGEVVDRATRLLGAAGAAVRIDEGLAGLLDARFEVIGDAAGLTLTGERAPDPEPRILDRPIPFAGREREIAALIGAFRSSSEEEFGRAVLVVGPAGSGKSRLARELAAAVGRRGEPVELWAARADPLETKPFSFAGRLLRDAAGIRDADPPAARIAKLRGRTRRHVSPRHADRVTAFLGIVAGLAPQDGDELAATVGRLDAAALEAGARRAFVDLLAVECDARPVVLILDDLHAADDTSVGLVDAALDALGERRLLVVAAARPDVRDRFPGLWAGRAVADLVLGDLPRDAAERVARAALGDGTPREVVDALVARGAGNPERLVEALREAAASR